MIDKESPQTITPAATSGIVGRRRPRQFTVAIVTWSFAPAMQSTIDSIVEHLNEKAAGQFTCVLFDGKSDDKRLFNYVTQIIQNHTMPYDAIVTIGGKAGQTATRVSLLLNSKMPIIFSWVHNPVHMGLVYPGKRRTGNITGIATKWPDYNASLNTLKTLKKDISRVMIPYNPNALWAANQVGELSNLLSSSGIEVQLVQTPDSLNTVKVVQEHIHDIDTVVALRNQLVINHMNMMSKICSDYGVTVFTSDLESVDQGAAIGFAEQDSQAGVEIAEYILHVFHDDALPSELPVKTAEAEYYVGINREASERQGIELSESDLATLENKVIFSDEKNKETTNEK